MLVDDLAVVSYVVFVSERNSNGYTLKMLQKEVHLQDWLHLSIMLPPVTGLVEK